MTDNDLKYRYIKSKNGITPESLNEIENIFQYNRDKKPIGEIRQNLENYERQLIERIEQMEKNQLK